MAENDKLIELLLGEVRSLRSDIKDLHHKIEKVEDSLRLDIGKSNKDISTLKTKFMLVAMTMGLAGGKVSTIIPFLK